MYTPIADCITVFKLGFETTSGSLYDVNKEVRLVKSQNYYKVFNKNINKNYGHAENLEDNMTHRRDG